MAEPIAVVVDYDGLLAALRQRAIELNTPLESIDEVAGLPTRYTTKLLGGMRGLGRVSLGLLGKRHLLDVEQGLTVLLLGPG